MKQMRRIVAAGLLVPTLGCTALRPVAAPGSYISEHQPTRVYLIQSGGAVSVVDEPAVRGDQITGRFAGTLIEANVPLQDVTAVQVREPAPGRTALLLGGLGAALGVVVFLATRPDFDPNRPRQPHYCEPECVGAP